jgi:hypothetical protein
MTRRLGASHARNGVGQYSLEDGRIRGFGEMCIEAGLGRPPLVLLLS